MKKTFATKTLPLILLLSLGIIWGTGYSIARFAMTHGVNPMGYSFWQSLGPAVLIIAATQLTREKIKISVSTCRYYFICAITGIALPNTNMYFAAAHLPAGLLAVIVNTVPIMAYLFALLAGIEFFQWRRFLAVMLALSGLMIILLPGVGPLHQDSTIWIVLALITPVCFAFCSVYITRYQPKGAALSAAAGTLVLSSLLLTPIVFITGNYYAPHLPFTAPDWVILLEIVLSSIGYILLFQLIKLAGAVYYSFVDTIVALTGLFWGRMLFGEHLTIGTGSACCLILLALILINKQHMPMLESTNLFNRI